MESSTVAMETCPTPRRRTVRKTPSSRRRMFNTSLNSSSASPGEKMSACRCLFGPVDHNALKQELKELEARLNRQDNLRWNFDFSRETPLPGGRFRWEKVGKCDVTVPETYRLPGLATPASVPTVQPLRQHQSTQVSTSSSPVLAATALDKENLVASPVAASTPVTSRDSVTSPQRLPTPERHLQAKRKASPLMVRAPEKEAGMSLSKIRIQSRILDHFQAKKSCTGVRRKLSL